jgi:hypothetical protein
MSKTAVRVYDGKIEIEVETDTVVKFTLSPDDAIEFGIKLLRAAYSAKE